uniref:Uncharacterized protein n=1 Tax=Anguilla anguilla TaxID=7936 RepID=A0A0E9WYR3_ANGAN
MLIGCMLGDCVQKFKILRSKYSGYSLGKEYFYNPLPVSHLQYRLYQCSPKLIHCAKVESFFGKVRAGFK